MKHVYPVRHPASLDAAAKGSTTAAGEPSSPREQQESGGRQASATPRHEDVGRQVAERAPGGSADAGKVPVMGQACDEKIARERGPDRRRR